MTTHASLPPERPGSKSATELAAAFGLAQSGARPTIRTYGKLLWGRRHFIVEYARARNQAQYTATILGQFWQILTPILNAAVYYFIFGLILDTKADMNNFVAFLVIGVFIFTYTQRAVITGSRSVAGNLGLVRALHFPRATLPLASTVMELQQLLMSVVILFLVVFMTGEPLTLSWLLIIPALGLQTLFNSGLALIFARITARLRDMEQLLPFVLRTWQYSSGVFFSIAAQADGFHPAVSLALQLNPGAVYIDIVRASLMEGFEVNAYIWPAAFLWGIGMFLCGFIYFWRAEEKYGRD